MKRKVLWMLLSFLMALALVLSSCGPAAPSEEVGLTGEVTVLVGALGNQYMTPRDGTGPMSGIWKNLLWGGAIGVTPDNKQIPAIITEWEMAPDGISWTFHVKEGAKFHNGEEITAEDFAWSAEWYAYAAAAEPNAIKWEKRLDHAEVVDKYTFRLYFKEPYPGAVDDVAISQQLGPLPKDYFEEVGEAAYSANPVGNGPFKLVENIVGDRIVLEAFEDFAVPEMVPKYKTLTLLIVPEVSSRIAGLKTGLGDIILVTGGLKPDLEAAGLRTISLKEQAYVKGFFVGAGNPDIPFSQMEVRQALNLAIDADAIVEHILFGEGGALTTGEGTPSSFGYYPGAAVNRYDPEKARQLMVDAGYPDGFELTIHTFEGDMPNTPRISEQVAIFLEEIGITATVNLGDWNIIKQQLWDGEIEGDLIIRGNDGRFDQGSRFISWWRSDASLGFLPDPVLDDMIDAALSELDRDTRWQLYSAAYKYRMDNWMDLGIAYNNSVFGISGRIKEYYPRALTGDPTHLWSVVLYEEE